jgi:hypothetical protein
LPIILLFDSTDPLQWIVTFFLIFYVTWWWPLTKVETYRDHREHEIKHILLIVANEGFVLWFDNTRNRMHTPTIKIWIDYTCKQSGGRFPGVLCYHSESRWRSRYSDSLRTRRPRGRNLSPGSVNIFHVSISSRPALGLAQPPIQWVPEHVSPGIKRQKREGDHSPPTSAEVEKIWISTSTPHMSSWRNA